MREGIPGRVLGPEAELVNVGAGQSDETESPVRHDTEKVQSPQRKRGFKETVQESNTPPTEKWIPGNSAV